jgi:hypothetical protein
MTRQTGISPHDSVTVFAVVIVRSYARSSRTRDCRPVEHRGAPRTGAGQNYAHRRDRRRTSSSPLGQADKPGPDRTIPIRLPCDHR